MIKGIFEAGAMGCIGFTLFLALMSYGGIASAMRDEAGNFKKERSLKSVVGSIAFLCLLLGFLSVVNINYVSSLPTEPRFVKLWVNALSVFMIIHVYDLVVLDYLVIVKWHPKFLNLPDTDYYRTFRPHVIGFLKGIPLGLIVSLVSSVMVLWINRIA
jgi:hypothetical protein